MVKQIYYAKCSTDGDTIDEQFGLTVKSCASFCPGFIFVFDGGEKSEQR